MGDAEFARESVVPQSFQTRRFRDHAVLFAGIWRQAPVVFARFVFSLAFFATVWASLAFSSWHIRARLSRKST